MGIQLWLCTCYKLFKKKYAEQFRFEFHETSFNKIVKYLYTPTDSSSLAVTRILFGLAMLFDITDERGGATMNQRWGDPNTCHFPLLPYITALSMPYMAIVYAALWFGALGTMLGYRYRLTSAMFAVSHWYILLVDKSFWNNHSYLFGLVGFLLACTEANCFWSIDAYKNPSLLKETVPYWNYFILKYQFSILYFMAGVKKGTAEWLDGYSVQKLSEHWVFDPFKFFLTVPQIDYIVVHWFIFVFDLTVAGWMIWAPTRNVAMVFCALFHLMNSRLFAIGMFPWVCLATMPLFYPFHWPKMVIFYIQSKHDCLKAAFQKIKRLFFCQVTNEKVDDDKSLDKGNPNFDSNFDNETETESNDDDNDDVFEQDTTKKREIVSTIKKTDEQRTHDTDHDDLSKETEPNVRQKTAVVLIFMYMFLQAFLPFSHFITKGYNNWTNGLYGYSWDMMVHSWETNLVLVKIVDNESNKEFYLEPQIYSLNERWTRHGDMAYQYAHCIKDRLGTRKEFGVSRNVSIYYDVWLAMNGRFTQRLFNPKMDILKVNWSPFEEIPFLMPIINDGVQWREYLAKTQQEVFSWSERSDVTFIADFPGYEQERYIEPEMSNVTLTILQGAAAFEAESSPDTDFSYYLTKGERISVPPGLFHKVTNVGTTPVFYMYTFQNNKDTETDDKLKQPKIPLMKELWARFANIQKFLYLLVGNVFQICLWCRA